MSEQAVFYSWIENMPSSETIHISGGRRQKDADGKIMAYDHKEVRFSIGLLRTDDPETIEVLRALIKKGAPYTENKEIYLERVQSPEKNADRLKKQNVQLQATVGDLEDQIAKMKARLSAREAKREAATVAS